uniref:Uncharacterized protein n=1 Tax=Glossina brevipalpis TaxID=37001 RepID=A0A1A9W0B6_9MUSC
MKLNMSLYEKEERQIVNDGAHVLKPLHNNICDPLEAIAVIILHFAFAYIILTLAFQRKQTVVLNTAVDNHLRVWTLLNYFHHLSKTPRSYLVFLIDNYVSNS